MITKRNRKGFSFIELLVVITIIALLSTAAVVSYRSANKRARDNKRKSDFEQVRAALEMYRADEGVYPSGNWAAMISGLGDYINEAPADPTSYDYYYTRPTTTTYSLCAHFESETDSLVSGCGITPSCGTAVNCNYKVSNP